MTKTGIVTGGAGFIGSSLIWKLNQLGVDQIIVVDSLKTSSKWRNLIGLRYLDYMDKAAFLQAVQNDSLPFKPDFVVHLGACSATTETDADYLMENNYRYTRTLAEWAAERDIRFVYASSAATYGDGKHGFDDRLDNLNALRPLNMYGYSKHLFDLYAQQTGLLEKIVGLKFFNVFGPNEYHKGEMRSVVCKAFEQIRDSGTLSLFQSYRPDYRDGGQTRDFVYIKDCVDIIAWLIAHPQVNGLFNLGTGQARTWNDLAYAIFAAMECPADVGYIPMPEALRSKYQYHTEATMDKLKATGCPMAFRPLEHAVCDYVMEYLRCGKSTLAGSIAQD